MQVLVAQEQFVPMSQCDDSVLVRFQFGVLTTKQEQDFRDKGLDPRHFVALAVRTHYDEKSLQSKGFVYVAPPRGPLAMTKPDMQVDPWNANAQQRLFAVISHELGHIFGVQHTGTHRELMGAGFPEFAVTQSDGFESPRGIFRIPAGATLQRRCYVGSVGLPGFLLQFFAIPAGYQCIGLKIMRDRLEVVAARDANTPIKTIGTAPLDPNQMQYTFEPRVRIWLPDAQTVFKELPASQGRLLDGPMTIKRQATATYRNPEAGIEREILIQLSPEQIQISGVWDHKIVLDVFKHQLMLE